MVTGSWSLSSVLFSSVELTCKVEGITFTEERFVYLQKNVLGLTINSPQFWF